MITNGLPYYFPFGVSLVLVFGCSFLGWILRFILLMKTHAQNLSQGLIISLLVVGFNNFIVLLRPVTLTLRIFINVSLGHALLVNFSGNIVIVLFLLEMFVYVVQSFVFLTLVKSYLSFH